MLDAATINSRISVAGALCAADFAEAARLGFRTVVNFRPDGESATQLSSAEARATAEQLGLKYVHLPTTKFDVFTDDIVERAQTIFAESGAPVLAYCASGQRAAIVWAASEARQNRCSVNILDELAAAGFELGFLRDDLDAQADRARWSSACDRGTEQRAVA